MTHPQVLKECQQNLTRRYSHLEQTVAVGEQIDPAAVAQALSAGRLPASIATLSSRALAEVYGLRILDTDLQDRPDNATTFLFVRSER
jgi:prephenate dehydratase